MHKASNPRSACEDTEVMFINHASILIKRANSYVLTDPWHQKPAFGSWLPTLPQYVHPAYLASLGSNLKILISHGHDDHCDDELLGIFDKDTEIITANFSSPSVKNRLKRLGFQRITTVDSSGITISNGFSVKSFMNPIRSLDDATYTINTGNALIIHCNDNWFEFDKSTLAEISSECAKFTPKNIAFFSQTNSASGYPLNYRNFKDSEKQEILTKKVSAMIGQGLRNAAALGLSTFYSYAGYASVFVKDKPEYLGLGLLPTAKFINEKLLTDVASRELLAKIEVAELYPGDILKLSLGETQKAFVDSDDYSDDDIKSVTLRYYENYGIVDNCDTYRHRSVSTFDEKKLAYFLENLDRFAIRKVKSDGNLWGSVIGKSLEIVVEDLGISRRLIFGKGLADGSDANPPNKRMSVSSAMMSEVLEGRILFENLYTGYEAEWERFPPDTYNRDIVMFIVMYSYVYKNTLSSEYNRAAV